MFIPSLTDFGLPLEKLRMGLTAPLGFSFVMRPEILTTGNGTSSFLKGPIANPFLIHDAISSETFSPCP